jgi:2-polyprenyl-6-methoxyphenol hydroxylase-like FAD-dependent oxidoreductase
MLLAVLLVRGGCDVVVVEARTEISPRPRAIGIHPPAAAVLAEAGVDLGRGSVRIRGGEARADGRTLGTMAFGHPGVISLPQQEVERMLRATLHELRPGALRLGERVTSLTAVAHGVRLRGTDVVADLVVGADGVDSTVRRACGIRFRRRPGVAHYLMADLPGSAPTDDGLAVLNFERGGVVESFPLPGERRRWVAVMPRVAEPDLRLLARVVAERTGFRLPEHGTASSFTARQHLARSMVAGRVVLIGDAAHEVSPIGGQGLNLGWLDAKTLATLLLRQPHPSSAVLREFSKRRRRSATWAQALAGFNMLVGRRLPLPLHRLRSLAIRILARPPFRGAFADAFTMRRR